MEVEQGVGHHWLEPTVKLAEICRSPGGFGSRARQCIHTPSAICTFLCQCSPCSEKLQRMSRHALRHHPSEQLSSQIWLENKHQVEALANLRSKAWKEHKHITNCLTRCPKSKAKLGQQDVSAHLSHPGRSG